MILENLSHFESLSEIIRGSQHSVVVQACD